MSGQGAPGHAVTATDVFLQLVNGSPGVELGGDDRVGVAEGRGVVGRVGAGVRGRRGGGVF